MRRRWHPWAFAAAASVAMLLVGGAAGWIARGSRVEAADPLAVIASDGLYAHRLFVVDKRHPVEVSQSDQQQLVTWLSRRLDRRVQAPDLQSFGLRLLGGRLLPLCGGDPAAQLMYEDASGGRYTLFMTRGSGDVTTVRAVERDGMQALYWADDDMTYALVGSAPQEHLLEMSHSVQNQLDPPTG